MTNASNLKEGKYIKDGVLKRDVKRSLEKFFNNQSKKESSYKYVMFQAINDCMKYATGKTNKIEFRLLFTRFAEIYWVLVFENKIPQQEKSVKGIPATLAEKNIMEIAQKYKCKRKTKFCDLSVDAQNELVDLMSKQCSRYVFGSLFDETNQLLFSFSKQKQWIKINPLYVEYYEVHKSAIQKSNFQAWAKYYIDVVNLSGEEAYYKRLLKREFGDGEVKKIDAIKKKPHKEVVVLPISYNYEISRKVRSVLSKYPDLGLYLAQVCEQVDEGKFDVKAILDNSFWCKKEGSRYFYLNISDEDIVRDAGFEIQEKENLLSSTKDVDKGIEDEGNMKLLDSPELLIKKLKKRNKN